MRGDGRGKAPDGAQQMTMQREPAGKELPAGPQN